MENIDEILSSLSGEDIEALKQAAQSIFGSPGNDNEKNNSHAKEQSGGMDFSNILDAKMLGKISGIMSAINSKGSDSRCSLIEALKPNLSSKRQVKADEAIQIIRLLDIMPIIMEMNGKGE